MNKKENKNRSKEKSQTRDKNARKILEIAS
jgi:hypothetical protein